MDKLSKKDDLESQVIGEVERSSKAIASRINDSTFSMEDFAYEFTNSEAVNWIEFYGYKENKPIDGSLLVVKEVFRSVCYKFGIIFIDISLSEK